jgi:acyl-[acyl-carrier-protein] desaturase
MEAIRDVVTTFQMPGHGIENFGRKSVQIAMAGIYDLRIHHDEVLTPVLRQQRIFERTGLSPEAEKARDGIAEFLGGLDTAASRFEEKRAAHRARVSSRA